MTGQLPGSRRQVRGFRKVFLKDLGELNIIQGEEECLEIIADEDLLPNILSQVVDGVLTLEIDRVWLERLQHSFTFREVRYRLFIREIEEVEVYGIAFVQSPQLELESLSLRLSGRVKVDIGELRADRFECAGHWGIRLKVLSGSVRQQKITLDGHGVYDGSGMESETASLEIVGGSTASVRVSGNLNLSLSGNSQVTYHGDPQVQAVVDQDSRLIRES